MHTHLAGLIKEASLSVKSLQRVISLVEQLIMSTCCSDPRNNGQTDVVAMAREKLGVLVEKHNEGEQRLIVHTSGCRVRNEKQNARPNCLSIQGLSSPILCWSNCDNLEWAAPGVSCLAAFISPVAEISSGNKSQVVSFCQTFYSALIRFLPTNSLRNTAKSKKEEFIEQKQHTFCCKGCMQSETALQHKLVVKPVLGFFLQVFPQHPLLAEARERNNLHVSTSGREDNPGTKEGNNFAGAGENRLLGAIMQDLLSFSKIIGLSKAGILGFARVQGEPGMMEQVPLDENANSSLASQQPDHVLISKRVLSRFNVRLPTVELPNIEQLGSSAFSELMERVPQLGKSSQDYPDKKKLSSVQDFFKYTEAEGKRLFEELDRDKDGQVTIEDLEIAMKKRRLPQRYAREFLQRTRKNWLKKSFGWNEFLSLMEQKEPMMLRAFTSLSLNKSGTLQRSQVLDLLQNAGLPATEGNAAAMMRFLDTDTKGSITYGQFRNFLLLLPPERLGDDPRMVWFEAATVVPMAPPMEIHAGSVLKSALAGGLSCALSTCLMHPLDTMKTRVQASTLSFPELISNLPSIGIRGLYRGSVPAILGQFASHGLRTGVFESSKLLLTNFAPTISQMQVQSLASFCSTVLGTAIRIPCEVLKQRLQAGLYTSVGEAITGTLQNDGWKGFFRGTEATLCREVPFYVAGTMIYEETKKIVQQLIKRELEPWETIAIGGLSGGLAAVCTTPFDVMKTRMMTATPGVPITMSAIAVSIVREEGFVALFKGALPRFFWIAPLGAMNFAGYELAKRAMEKKE